MQATECAQRFTNKTVPFRFLGKDLSFQLSHALFSSYDIDDGTRLLLKSIAQNVDLAAVRSILDVGCGVGIIGACLKAAVPHARTVLQDRDALAATFASANCTRNKLVDVEVRCCLGFHDVEGRTDLIVSNLPAKAGQPVLQSMFRHASALLTSNGRVAIVIVSPLARFAREQIEEAECEVLHEEQTKEYLVLHFRPRVPVIESREELESIEPYIRARQIYSYARRTYELETAFSLPDFDTLGHRLELSMEVLSGVAAPGDVLFWNPGQGHLPAFLQCKSAALAGRDALELAVTKRNLTAEGREPSAVAPVPSERELREVFAAGSFSLLVAEPRPVPRVPWQEELALSAKHLIRPGGLLFVSSTSTEMHRFIETAKGLRMLGGKKQLGNRAVLFKQT